MSSQLAPKQSADAGRVKVDPTVPPTPSTLKDTGLAEESLVDLLVKAMYIHGARSGQQIANSLRLPFPLIDELIFGLQQRRFVEVRGTAGHGRGGYIFDLVGGGRERAREALVASQYVGPAPVPLSDYRGWVEVQSVRNAYISREEIQAGFGDLVLDPSVMETLGPAINSAKSLFLHGDSGNGKTVVAETIARLLGGAVYLPHAVDIDGEIMVVYDPVHHRPTGNGAADHAEAETLWIDASANYDRRYEMVSRPVVMTGGELTLEQLDLQYDPFTKMYQAPFQVKANGGILIVDDFGRQRVPPRDLLNRWIVPLEKRVDFLTLHTGNKFPVPFDCLLIFATNLDPSELVEEAFLRRIHYKVRMQDPTREEYETIFRRCCASRGLAFAPECVERVYREYYQRLGIPVRACHPRDLIDHMLDIARYLKVEPQLSADLLDRACHSYFISAGGVA